MRVRDEFWVWGFKIEHVFFVSIPKDEIGVQRVGDVDLLVAALVVVRVLEPQLLVPPRETCRPIRGHLQLLLNI